jgi:hypothetical protein
MGESIYRSRILDLGTSWRWVISFTPKPLYTLGKSPRYPLDRLGWPQDRHGRRRERYYPYRDSNSDPTAMSTALSWLIPNLYKMNFNIIHAFSLQVSFFQSVFGFRNCIHFSSAVCTLFDSDIVIIFGWRLSCETPRQEVYSSLLLPLSWSQPLSSVLCPFLRIRDHVLGTGIN